MTSKELKAARTRFNLTAKEMAEKLNTPKRTYEGWELGRTKIPGIVSVTTALIEKKNDSADFLRGVSGVSGVIGDLEYAAFNLCEKTDSDIKENVIESTCPDASLFIAIRRLKELAEKQPN